MNDLAIIRRSLRRQLLSTVVTVLLVAVSVALLVLLVGLRSAASRAFTTGIGNLHLLVSRDSSPLVGVLNGLFHVGAPRRALAWADYERIVDEYPLAWAIPLQQGDSYRGLPVVATTPAFFTDYRPEADEPWAFAAGEAFDAPFEIVVGAAAARESGLGLGDEIVLAHGASSSDADEHHGHVHDEFAWHIVGVLEPTGGPHDRALFTDLDSSWIVHAHDRLKRDDPHAAAPTVEQLTDADRLLTGIYLRVPTRGGAEISGAEQAVFDALRRDGTITVASPRQEITRLLSIVGTLDDLFVAMGAAVMLASACAIMLALYSSMAQRRRQIAVLRVLGCSRGRVMSLVLTESALLGAMGAVLGVALAIGGAVVTARVLRSRVGLVVDPGVDLVLAATIVLVAIALAALAGMVPAVAAYRTSVVRHLRPLG